MKKLFTLTFILFFAALSANADYYYMDNNSSSYNTYSNIGGTYYSSDLHKPTSYNVSGNTVYGSDGSSYTRLDNTYQNNFTGQTYQVNNNFIQELY